MNQNLQLVRVIRVIFVILVFVLGMMMWNKLPERIPVHFNSAMEPDEFGNKQQILAAFFLPVVALFSFTPEKIKAHSLDVSEEELEQLQYDEDRKSTILCCVHSFLMCFIFLIIMYFVKKHS